MHRHRGLDALGAGLLVSLQYVATFTTRPRAGLLTDTIGPKRTVIYGLCACMVGGLFLALGSLLRDHHWPSRFAISRLAMGNGESFCGTGAVMWSLGTVGLAHTGIVRPRASHSTTFPAQLCPKNTNRRAYSSA